MLIIYLLNTLSAAGAAIELLIHSRHQRPP